MFPSYNIIQIVYYNEYCKLIICCTLSAFQEVKKYGNLVNEIQYNSQKVKSYSLIIHFIILVIFRSHYYIKGICRSIFTLSIVF